MTSALLQQIVRGLDGVTPGRWFGVDRAADERIRAPEDSIVGAKMDYGPNRAVARRPKLLSADEWRPTRDHIARCSPDAMREIAAAFEALEHESEELRIRLAGAFLNIGKAEARATAAEATVTALKEKLGVAEEALERLSGGEALTNSFYVKDNSEGKELRARMDFAQAALLNLRSKP